MQTNRMEKRDKLKITQELEDIANNSSVLPIHDKFWNFFCPAFSVFGAFVTCSAISDIPFVQEMHFFPQYAAKTAAFTYGLVSNLVSASIVRYIDERRILAREISKRQGIRVSIFGEYTSFD